MRRGLFLAAIVTSILLSGCNTPSSAPTFSPSAIASRSAAATSVRITRDPGLFIMPALDRTITNRTTVKRLATDILSLPAFPPGAYSCPADFGTTYTLRFGGGSPWSAVVDILGCRGVQLSDGRNLWALTTPSLATDLRSALGLSTNDFSPIPCMTGETRCYPQPHQGMGLVTGGIRPCAGIVDPRAPRYAAGTVEVQKTNVPRQPSPLIVAEQKLAVNQQYVLALSPGDYVLQADFPPPADVHPFIVVTVKADQAIQADIPNMCI